MIQHQQEFQQVDAYLGGIQNHKLYECWQIFLPGLALIVLVPSMAIQRIQEIGSFAGGN